MTTNENNTDPYMKSLSLCLQKMADNGYTEDYKATEEGLESLRSNRVYHPAEVHIINFFRFEGASDPDYNEILYVIETDDGGKGTLVDAYGPYASPEVNHFMSDVHDIHKKVRKSD